MEGQPPINIDRETKDVQQGQAWVVVDRARWGEQ